MSLFWKRCCSQFQFQYIEQNVFSCWGAELSFAFQVLPFMKLFLLRKLVWSLVMTQKTQFVWTKKLLGSVFNWTFFPFFSIHFHLIVIVMFYMFLDHRYNLFVERQDIQQYCFILVLLVNFRSYRLFSSLIWRMKLITDPFSFHRIVWFGF